MSKWFEHFFILPIKWYKQNYRNWIELNQRCKVCGNRDKFDFHVTEEIWSEIVPLQYQNRVVCLSCFDDFAKEKGIQYKDALDELCFAGDMENLNFHIK